MLAEVVRRRDCDVVGGMRLTGATTVTKTSSEQG